METATATTSDTCQTPSGTKHATSGRIIRIGVLEADPQNSELLRGLFAAEDWCHCRQVVVDPADGLEAVEGFDVTLLVDRPEASPEADASLRSLQHRRLERLSQRRMSVLVLTDRPWAFAGFNLGVMCLPADSSLELVQGALMALAHVRPVVRQVDKQLGAMQRLSRNLQKRFAETDQELQLASRLQRDFLPHEIPEIGPLRFTTMFRPCSWVSGDIFDIFRLDEHHWGFYLADAVGHGVAAGLLAMYIKHAIQPKRIGRDGYELLPPSQVLAHLNDVLACQDLPNSQFITGWYGFINIETLVLKYAVAGHPPALHVSPDGNIRELRGDGCLLGLGTGVAFSDESVTLQPGHRVLVYSDGLEPTLIAHRPPMPEEPRFEGGICELLQEPADDFVVHLRERLDSAPGSLTQADDVSVLMMDVRERAPER